MSLLQQAKDIIQQMTPKEVSELRQYFSGRVDNPVIQKVIDDMKSANITAELDVSKSGKSTTIYGAYKDFWLATQVNLLVGQSIKITLKKQNYSEIMLADNVKEAVEFIDSLPAIYQEAKGIIEAFGFSTDEIQFNKNEIKTPEVTLSIQTSYDSKFWMIQKSPQSSQVNMPSWARLYRQVLPPRIDSSIELVAFNSSWKKVELHDPDSRLFIYYDNMYIDLDNKIAYFNERERVFTPEQSFKYPITDQYVQRLKKRVGEVSLKKK